MDAILKKEQLGAIVGPAHVSDDAVTLDGYAHDQSLVPALRPWFVVRPADGAQVQALVTWANATRTPLVPVSSGPPHFHGDTVPSVPGAVIVDLGRLNTIRRIDTRNRIAGAPRRRPRLLRRGARAEHPGHHPQRPREPRRPWDVHGVRHRALSVGGPAGPPAPGPAARIPDADSRQVPCLHDRRPELGRVRRDLLQDLRQWDRVHLPPAVEPGRRRHPADSARRRRGDRGALRPRRRPTGRARSS